jgi:6,7-dimethyl-8-ribityllumazine synthase
VSSTGKHILIVEARFYPEIADLMKAGAIKVLEDRGYTYQVVDVPGALEIPAAIAFGAKSGKFAGFIALGCVIRGETGHYDHVSTEAIRSLQTLGVKKKLCLGTGILTVENRDQAHARAGQDKGNKGAAATEACLALIEVREHLLGAS